MCTVDKWRQCAAAGAGLVRHRAGLGDEISGLFFAFKRGRGLGNVADTPAVLLGMSHERSEWATFTFFCVLDFDARYHDTTRLGLDRGVCEARGGRLARTVIRANC